MTAAVGYLLGLTVCAALVVLFVYRVILLATTEFTGVGL
jgi:hypothetical protein